MCRIADLLNSDRILCGVEVADRDALLSLLAEHAAREAGLAAEAVVAAVKERERFGTTAVGHGVAIPHCRLKGGRDITLVAATLKNPLPYDAPDGEGVRLVFFIVVCEGNNLRYLKVLSRLSVLCNDRGVRDRLMAAPDADAFLAVLKGVD